MEIMYTRRLKLRPYRLDDIDLIHAYASDENVVRYMLFGPNTYIDSGNFIHEIIDKYYQEKPISHLEYAIEMKGILIGGVSIHIDFKTSEGNIGWILNPHYHNQGIATEAAECLKTYAVSKFHLKRIIATCDARNIPSQKVMIKLGLKLLKIEKNARMNKKTGVYEFDNLIYELII